MKKMLLVICIVLFLFGCENSFTPKPPTITQQMSLEESSSFSNYFDGDKKEVVIAKKDLPKELQERFKDILSDSITYHQVESFGDLNARGMLCYDKKYETPHSSSCSGVSWIYQSPITQQYYNINCFEHGAFKYAKKVTQSLYCRNCSAHRTHLTYYHWN